MPPAREVGQRFVSAWQFLTLIPLHRHRALFEEAAVFFPLVGGLLGLALACGFCLGLQFGLPAGLAAALAIGGQSLLTGFYREAGLAGIVDAAYAGSTRETMLETLAHPYPGPFGSTAVAITLLVRWQALAALALSPMAFVLAAGIAAGMLSRGSVILLAAISQPTGSGISAGLVGKTPGWLLLLTGLQLSVAGSLMGWRGTAPALLGGLLLVLALRFWFTKRMGGVHGHSLSTCSISMECLALSIAAWLGHF